MSPPDTRTRLLDAALAVIRARGYTATGVADICAAAGVSKGAFFHHFESKEALAVAAAERWSTGTSGFFAAQAYHAHADPLDRVFGYLAFRRALLRGPPAEFTCFAGTTVQETFDTSPTIRAACERCIVDHAAVVAKDIALARALHAPDAAWSAEGLALHTQAVLQGAFVLAKARGGPEVAIDSVDHLIRYVELLFNRPARLVDTPERESE